MDRHAYQFGYVPYPPGPHDPPTLHGYAASPHTYGHSPGIDPRGLHLRSSYSGSADTENHSPYVSDFHRGADTDLAPAAPGAVEPFTPVTPKQSIPARDPPDGESAPKMPRHKEPAAASRSAPLDVALDVRVESAPATTKTTRQTEKSSAKADAVRQSSDKVVLRTFLTGEAGQQMIQREVRKWVSADIASVKTDVHRQAEEQVGKVLERYKASVNAFRSEVITVGGDLVDCEGLDASDDGYVYLRIHEVSLADYFVKVKGLEKRCQDLDAKLRAVLARIELLEGLAAGAPPHASGVLGGPSAPRGAAGLAVSGPPAAPPTNPFKTHNYAPAQTHFKNLVARMAGLPTGRGVADTGPKIYHYPFPANLAEWKTHPPTYEATDADLPLSASERPAGSAPTFRCLRLDFLADWSEEPNYGLLAPILKMMARNHVKYDLLPGMTPDDLMTLAFSRTWANWVKGFKKTLVKTAAELAQEREELNLKQRRKVREETKRKHRMAESQRQAAGEREGRLHDMRNTSLFVPELQSDDYSDTEVLPGMTVPSDVRVLRTPAYRSQEATKAVRSCDAGAGAPKRAIIDRGETFDLPAGSRFKSNIPRWALKAEWAEQNPDRTPSLLSNRGPFTGPRAVASSADAYGTGSYDRAACGVSKKGSAFRVIALPAGVVLPGADGSRSGSSAVPGASETVATSVDESAV
ncbi:hypothetical protein OC835_003144 [Tilletia horrida]|nr:hypothetical protein OC835_003144 [Tilletia horrida]